MGLHPLVIADVDVSSHEEVPMLAEYAARIVETTLGASIEDIIALCTPEKMIRVKTDWIVAMMEYALTGEKRSFKNEVRDAMDEVAPAVPR